MEDGRRRGPPRWRSPGDAVVLSPACSSFDMFRDYAHRAEVFRAAVARVAAGERALVKPPAKRARDPPRRQPERRRAAGARRGRAATPTSRIKAGALDVWSSITALARAGCAATAAGPPDPPQRGRRRPRAGRRRAGAGRVRRGDGVLVGRGLRRARSTATRPTSSSASSSTPSLGLGALSLATRIDYSIYRRLAYPLLFVSVCAAGGRAEDRLARGRRHPLVPPRPAVVPAGRAGQVRARASTWPTCWRARPRRCACSRSASCRRCWSPA